MGHFMHGKWFCSPACADKDPDTKRISDMLERKERGEVSDDDQDVEGEEIDI